MVFQTNKKRKFLLATKKHNHIKGIGRKGGAIHSIGSLFWFRRFSSIRIKAKWLLNEQKVFHKNRHLVFV